MKEYEQTSNNYQPYLENQLLKDALKSLWNKVKKQEVRIDKLLKEKENV